MSFIKKNFIIKTYFGSKIIFEVGINNFMTISIMIMITIIITKIDYIIITIKLY